MSVTPIPKEVYRHLNVVYRDGSALVGDVTCRCGGTAFYVLRNVEIRVAAEKKEAAQKRATEYFQQIGKKPNRTATRDGKVYLQSVGLFGKEKVEFCLTDAADQTDVVVKAKCAECGEEILLFDSKKHMENSATESEKQMEPFLLVGSDTQTAKIQMTYRFQGFAELSAEESAADGERVCFDSVEIDAYPTDVKDKKQDVLEDTEYCRNYDGLTETGL